MADRACVAEDCATVLSRYNDTDLCGVHGGEYCPVRDCPNWTGGGHCSVHRPVRHRERRTLVPTPAPPPWTHDGSDMPNPWHRVAPPCPFDPDHGSALTLLWAPGPLPWICLPCSKRFDGPEPVIVRSHQPRTFGSRWE